VIRREIRFASGRTNALLENKVGLECATGGRLWSPNARRVTARESERTKADKFRPSSRECKCCRGRAIKRTELIPRCIRSKEAANDYVALRTRRMKATHAGRSRTLRRDKRKENFSMDSKLNVASRVASRAMARNHGEIHCLECNFVAVRPARFFRENYLTNRVLQIIALFPSG